MNTAGTQHKQQSKPEIVILSETLAEIERDIRLYDKLLCRCQADNNFVGKWRYHTIRQTLQTDKTAVLDDYIRYVLQ